MEVVEPMMVQASLLLIKMQMKRHLFFLLQHGSHTLGEASIAATILSNLELSVSCLNMHFYGLSTQGIAFFICQTRKYETERMMKQKLGWMELSSIHSRTTLSREQAQICHRQLLFSNTLFALFMENLEKGGQVSQPYVCWSAVWFFIFVEHNINSGLVHL